MAWEFNLIRKPFQHRGKHEFVLERIFVSLIPSIEFGLLDILFEGLYLFVTFIFEKFLEFQCAAFEKL